MKKILFLIIALFLNYTTVFAEETKAKPISTKETVIETYSFKGDILNYETLIPNEINHNGDIYLKTDIKVDEKTRTETLDIQETVEKIITEQEKSNAILLFDKELSYEKDSLKGVLKIDENSLEVTKNTVENITKYNDKKYTVYEDKTYYGLESNDYSLLPKNIMKNGVVLKLITADFVKTNSKDTYNAICKYGGTYTKKVPTSKEIIKDYKAKVNYVGTVNKEVVESRDVTVFYEKNSIYDKIEEPLGDNIKVTLENNLSFILIIVLISMIFIIILLLIFVITKQLKIKEERRKNFEKYKQNNKYKKNRKNEK